MQRRSFLVGSGAILAAPAIVRTAGLLMPLSTRRQWMLHPELALVDSFTGRVLALDPTGDIFREMARALVCFGPHVGNGRYYFGASVWAREEMGRQAARDVQILLPPDLARLSWNAEFRGVPVVVL
jgi:hypothetical protein